MRGSPAKVVVCGHVISMEGIFVRQLQPKTFAMFVEGVPQLVKNPVGGFVIFCRHEPGTELTDFGFGGHRVVSGKSP